ncbi:hypothetical protein K491DRAFT_700934 [Lophiostoma macrostomum CBS 122681]|uniref:F-box domain-containing protein n=1 Tax=Lophiostoma macrostomum CBS 122681 TaxID=1314788 RepID=A0A6A6TQ32_9PLEO|nr:hypothetical protein K491DRAFT_700934 [Lophiostoma macrostomum CBS 122681]
MDSTEAELESFRRRWREEVSAKTKGQAPASANPLRTAQASSSRTQVLRSNAPDVHRHGVEQDDEAAPHAYQDLGEKQHGRRLDETNLPSHDPVEVPDTALEHYEKAVEKEGIGSLGDSVDLYRKAYRLDPNVHTAYKNKHFPASSFPVAKPKPSDPNPSNASATVPNPAHHSLHGLPPTLQSLIDDFSTLTIQGEPPPTEHSPAPPCPISTIPEELLADILIHLAVQDIASFVRLSLVCKRLAYLVATEDRVWKRISLGSEYGFGAMHYRYACQIDGSPLGDDGSGGILLGSTTSSSSTSTSPTNQPAPQTTTPLVPTPYPTYLSLFRRRPRIRFNGCYISTVNYMRPGASSPTSVSWNSPIHIVTYYRYLRFLRNGTLISLLTTSEPADVVPYLYLEHAHKNHGNLPSAPMKDALLGRWRLSGPAGPSKPYVDSSSADGEGEVEMAVEDEGTLYLETEGVTPKYLYKMALTLGTAGKGARNNKLSWQGYWSYNRLTDDWAAFTLKNDRPFYFSRVRRYGMGFEA